MSPCVEKKIESPKKREREKNLLTITNFGFCCFFGWSLVDARRERKHDTKMLKRRTKNTQEGGEEEEEIDGKI